MSNKYKLAPLADTAETEYRNSRENSEGIDDGLLTHNEKPSTRNDGVPSQTPPTYPSPIPNPKEGVRPLDINIYAMKKTVAQGMMDVALLTANANQLRYVLESGNASSYYYISVAFISMSIILQLAIGIALTFLGRYDMMDEVDMTRADRLNNFITLAVFLITAVNVLISAFGMQPVERMDPALIVDETLKSLKLQTN